MLNDGLASLQDFVTTANRPVELTIQQARNLHLFAQGLLRPARARATRGRLLAAIERMQLLQIDTIHVVARSPYLVLFSRLGPYPQAWLAEALAAGRIFECWAHEACFAPADTYPLLRPGSNPRDHHWAHKHAQRAHREQRAGMDRLLAHVREHGPVKAADFDRPRRDKGNGWWGWKDEKRWLEASFARGELMIARRDNFQRVYDIAERVLERMGTREPAALDPAAIRNQQILRSVRALGVAQARWIADYFRLGRKIGDDELSACVERGELLRVGVRGWDVPGYVHRDHALAFDRARNRALRASHTALLSPFDPVVWDRARASALFDFDYTLECYTPAPRRRYGYFVLPILRHGRLVGRLDAKAHRDDGTFEIKALYLEPVVKAGDSLLLDLAAAIRACADWHGTPAVVIRKTDPKPIAARLRSALAAA